MNRTTIVVQNGAPKFSAYGYEMSQMVKRGRYEDLLDRPFGKVPTIYETDADGNIGIKPVQFTGLIKIFTYAPDDSTNCPSAEIENVPSPVCGANYVFTLDGTQYQCTAKRLSDVSRTLEDGSVQDSVWYDDGTGSNFAGPTYYWGNLGLTGLPDLNSDTSYYGEDTGESYLIFWSQGNLVIYLGGDLATTYLGENPASSLVPAEEYFTLDEKYLPECVVTEETLAEKNYATKSYVDDAVANAGGGGSYTTESVVTNEYYVLQTPSEEMPADTSTIYGPCHESLPAAIALCQSATEDYGDTFIVISALEETMTSWKCYIYTNADGTIPESDVKSILGNNWTYGDLPVSEGWNIASFSTTGATVVSATIAEVNETLVSHSGGIATDNFTWGNMDEYAKSFFCLTQETQEILLRPDWNQNSSVAKDYVKNRPGAYVSKPGVTYTFDGSLEGKTYISTTLTTDDSTIEYNFVRVGDCLEDISRLVGCTAAAVEGNQSGEFVIDSTGIIDVALLGVEGCAPGEVTLVGEGFAVNVTKDIDAALLFGALTGSEVEATPCSSGLYLLCATITYTDGESTTTMDMFVSKLVVPPIISKLPSEYREQGAFGDGWTNGAYYTYDGNQEGKVAGVFEEDSGSVSFILLSEDTIPCSAGCDFYMKTITTASDGTVSEDASDGTGKFTLNTSDSVSSISSGICAVSEALFIAYSDVVFTSGLVIKKGVYAMDTTETSSSTGATTRVYPIRATIKPGVTKIPATFLDAGTAKNLTLYSGNWSGTTAPYTYTLSVSGITANTNGMIGLSQSATSAQAEAARNAKIRISSQSSGSLTLSADGVKPTQYLPITLIIL